MADHGMKSKGYKGMKKLPKKPKGKKMKKKPVTNMMSGRGKAY